MRKGTGNRTTALRVAAALAGVGEVVLVDVASEDGGEWPADVPAPDVALGIHAFRSAEVLSSLGCPYAVIFGGTDVNEAEVFAKHPVRGPVMRAALEGAHACVAFSESVVAAGEALGLPMPGLMVIPPEVGVPEVDVEALEASAPALAALAPQSYALLLASFRSVKDPGFLLSAWRQAWKSGLTGGLELVVVGPVLDRAASSPGVLATGPGIVLHDCVSHGAAMALLANARVLLNTSHSEGLANAVLEAAALGIPLALRASASNTAYAADHPTVALFSDPNEAIAIVADLAGQPNESSMPAHAASGESREALAYCSLVRGIAGHG
ncbi:glycosyltransferase 1 domain-containing protein 1 [Thecamonas trahens ATCC 50062]|uniref:Glycosyltransferase 1 domain-containing protein 1 n=1 Tax=Thecamonas trahens ATCC 50062 TaxID=461836 RepID=A0A0L0D9G9_THETB|nr:glycosyltransferase 1 domain-containing protein 1 [Thecamonas trahens ATCC 50062]KNC47948.1 glycosyltransferase 1 domain-containing protein 1 [Thecamonas trahens ATCC 50062]|eukprot:XP_013758965.1 glycosyltransferase 1 domain-containing protein 1 [Thecamonas trahens ATCC 50062]